MIRTSSNHDLNTGFKGIGIKLEEKLHTQGNFYLREGGRTDGWMEGQNGEYYVTWLFFKKRGTIKGDLDKCTLQLHVLYEVNG